MKIRRSRPSLYLGLVGDFHDGLARAHNEGSRGAALFSGRLVDWLG